MDNPLLSRCFEVPFDRIRAEHVEPAIDQLLQEAQARIDAIVAVPGPRTYTNTLGALEQATEPLDFAMSVVGHLESVATYPELRAAYNSVQPRVSAFYSAIPMNEGLWQALRSFAGTAQALPSAHARYLKKTLDDFRRHGALLDAAGKERLGRINVELTQITTRFAQNVLDATSAFELYITDEARLGGLPETARAMARQSAEQKGQPGWRFTLHEPSLVAVLTYLDDAAIREALWRASSARATSGERDNRPLIARILELRGEKARLLGYRHFADLVLEDRMAHDGATARRFVDDLRQRARPAFDKERAALQAFRAQLEGPTAPPLAPWDLAYYAEKQRRALYDFDEEVLRPYLPAQAVLAGLFGLVQRLYGIRIEPRPAAAWDPSVQSYGVYDADGSMLAGFYVDLYPRDNKRGGAWMDSLIIGVSEGVSESEAAAGGGSDSRHLGLFCANVQPPVGDHPALLSLNETETLFHEFGHLLHLALSRVPVRSLAGTNVPWDFVELPSQIMENFCWERESLDLFARHYQSGERIPDEILERMQRARTYRAATAMMRQLGFATVDLLLHTEYSPERDGDVVAYGRRILQEHAAAPLPADYGLLASFNHLFSSPVAYAAGYYSYKWAEVLDADAFQRFKEAGVVSPEVGREFRRAILEQGDSRDPLELFISFRKRAPSLDPLLARAGLLVAA
ncbi:MAG: M3 family metallopeptidase [Polyangia bacterium]